MTTIKEKPIGLLAWAQMGSRMAQRLLAPATRSVYNRTSAKAEALAAKGAAIAESLVS